MYLSTSNVLKGLTPTITSGLGTELPTNITTSDHSLNYTSSSTTFGCSFDVSDVISYIAISAKNIAGATITGNIVGGLITDSSTVERDHIIMFTFPAQASSSVKIQISGGSKNPIINHIAAGSSIKIPNGGEVGGYARQWLTRNVQSRTVSNNIGAPITNLVSRKPITGKLTLPNMPTSFVIGEWQNFLDFAASGETFYLTENPDASFNRNEESYACFNPKFSAPSAHPDTRALNSVSIGFSCYNGL